MRTISTLLVALALAGCASSAVEEGALRVLERFPEEGTFERLGVVLVRGVGITSDASMFERLADEAAERGANAVVLQTPKVVDRTLSSGSIERRLAGFAIRVRP